MATTTKTIFAARASMHEAALNAKRSRVGYRDLQAHLCGGEKGPARPGGHLRPDRGYCRPTSPRPAGGLRAARSACTIEASLAPRNQCSGRDQSAYVE